MHGAIFPPPSYAFLAYCSINGYKLYLYMLLTKTLQWNIRFARVFYYLALNFMYFMFISRNLVSLDIGHKCAPENSHLINFRRWLYWFVSPPSSSNWVTSGASWTWCVCTLIFCFFKIHFNIILSSLLLRTSHQSNQGSSRWVQTICFLL